METLDRGFALSSQFKDLLRKPVESTRPSVYNQRPQPNRLVAGSRTNSPKGVDEDRSGPGWRVYGSRLRSPEQRVSTPPGITRQGSDWDPSYGFLSPQLGTRNQAQQRRWNQSNIPRNVNSATRNAPVTARNGSPLARNSPVNIPGSKQSVLAPKSEQVSSRNGSICSGKSVVSSGNPVISTRNAIYGRNVSSSGWNSPAGFRERSDRFQSQDETPPSSVTSAWNTRQPVSALHGPRMRWMKERCC
ncbi:uncharacterized protein LOC111712170 [Eurytemora carolleeae]|uniref:uncharacterized protein LOC111712170 n=1 Tax=Eurytemora carolleeae TaxID=1294199 RepID=UPI000C76A964|nr:uncharacterized protein LOC111712170 [Eurytemora carolleeae]|eukprot:XP_023342482.1 uncharacterized protein LOC111712170 [Eurytemora affinis]